MEGYLLLPIAVTVQVGTVDEEAHRGVRRLSKNARCALMERVVCRSIRISCMRRLSSDDSLRSSLRSARCQSHSCVQLLMYEQARANKNSNKPETELKEFEAVRPITTAEQADADMRRRRSWRNTKPKGWKIKRSKRTYCGRRKPRRSGQRNDLDQQSRRSRVKERRGRHLSEVCPYIFGEMSGLMRSWDRWTAESCCGE